MNEETKTPFDCFAIVEVMGHKVVAGRVTEQVIAGQGFIRVDVPAAGDQAGFTQMFGPSSIYAITPTTEEIARAFVARNVGAPIQPYQLRLPEKVSGPPFDAFDDEDETKGYDPHPEDDEPPF